jgi:hypothetical protein
LLYSDISRMHLLVHTRPTFWCTPL